MPMYTRCPKCRTTFAITRAHLEARGGLVRCGRCSSVFHAEQLSKDGIFPGDSVEAKAPGAAKPARPAAKRTARKSTRKAAAGPASKAAPKPRAERKSKPAPRPADTDPNLPLFDTRRPPHTRTPFWIAGSIALILSLLAQAVYFYGGRLVLELPALDPVLSPVCALLGCRLTPPQRIDLIDLVEAQVAPHPRFDRALRIRATLVNRASHVQTYPHLEVSLSTSKGLVVARRVFTPHDYLAQPTDGDDGLPPYVAVKVSLDVTHPDVRASGYEIRVLPAP
jgi:predicted Zn finger-like uncharacterized protein